MKSNQYPINYIKQPQAATKLKHFVYPDGTVDITENAHKVEKTFYYKRMQTNIWISRIGGSENKDGDFEKILNGDRGSSHEDYHDPTSYSISSEDYDKL